MDEPRRNPTERAFRVALLIKGVDGVAGVLAALFLLLVPGSTLHRLVADVIARDLLGSSHSWLARHLATATDEFVAGNRMFAVVFIGLHGIVKIVLVLALMRKWLPGYPVVIAVLGAFVVYELYRAARTGSLLLPFLAVLDIAVIVVVLREYRLLRHERAGLDRAR